MKNQTDEEIVLTEDFLGRCFYCGNGFNVKGVYDFYCCKDCENKDQEWMSEMVGQSYHPVDIMNESLRRIKPNQPKEE